MRLTKIKAQDIIRRVEGSERFFNKDGTVFAGLTELSDGIKTMPQDVFNFHCNSQKCDFASWIADILHDDVLAGTLVKAKGVRKTIESHIAKRVDQLAKYK